MTSRLTRRDAVIALGTALAGTGTWGVLTWDALTEDGDPAGPSERETIVATAEALYPSEVDGIDSFVETYVVGRIREREAYREGVEAAALALDQYAHEWYDAPFAELDRSTRQAVFDEYGLDRAEPDPSGSERERVRYYLLNELLYAFYSSPTGGELVGIENPQGYPGGTESYRRGP